MVYTFYKNGEIGCGLSWFTNISGILPALLILNKKRFLSP